MAWFGVVDGKKNARAAPTSNDFYGAARDIRPFGAGGSVNLDLFASLSRPGSTPCWSLTLSRRVQMGKAIPNDGNQVTERKKT